jgi:hypothetical protein
MPPNQETRKTFTFPELHEKVVDAVSDEMATPWFRPDDGDDGRRNKYHTNVVGKFKCTNKACSKKGWSSGVVATVIKGYRLNGYNAVVFNQNCKKCKQLGTFTMDEQTYVDRVAYRIKKWAGVSEATRPFDSSKRTKPHESSLCEGCKQGVCKRGGFDS